MIFAAPWVLLALPALPLLWWLLRVTPPAPRSEVFPAIRLLMGLHAREETPARTPWWLLALRMIAASLVILALARPVLDAGSALPGSGPMLLVVDNGWASASDWPHRVQSANSMLDRADHFNVNLDRSTDGLGNFGSMRSRVSTMICDTARLRNHFLFDGMTNHGAADELHRLSAAS